MIFSHFRPFFAIGTAGVFLMPGPAQGQTAWYARDRWQLELKTGTVVFECQLRERQGDILLIAARGTFGALAGADDEVYQLTLLSVSERREVVDSLLRRHPPHS